MPTEIAFAIALFAAMVLGVLIYIVARLHRDSQPPDVTPRARQLARFAGFPSLFDGLLARPMNVREKLGWLVFSLVAILAIVCAGERP